MAKQSKAKQRYEDRRRHNQIVAQLQGLKDQGFTADQIRNAGKNAYQTLSQQTPATTPATATPTYANAPAWAQSAYNPNPGAFDAAITGMQQSLQANAPQQPLQWWQRGTPGAPADRPSPFSSVTGTAGLGTNQTRPPAYGGSYNPTTANGNTPTPYVPQWLAGRPPAYGGSYNTTAMNRRPKTTPTLASTNPTTPGNPGTLGNRTPNPLTGIPDFPMLSSLGDAPGGGGYNWKKRRRGRGGGRSLNPAGYVANNQDRGPFIPSSGMANWSIG